MGEILTKALDECLTRTSGGESIETCLSDYPDMRGRLEPLLHIAMSITSMPKLAPPEDFKNTAVERLAARLDRESNQTKVVTIDERVSPLNELALMGQRLWQAIVGVRKIAIPVTIALILAIVTTAGLSNFISTSPALASQCTLSVLEGNVEIQAPQANDSQPGIDGMTLSAGAHVRTAADSHALLTFFDGSTIELEPGTEIEVEQLEHDGQSINIVLKQWLGQTWSRVVKMADSGSHYKIETPSACAIVRGTRFLTEVDLVGATSVLTAEGLVSVIGQDTEVFVPVGTQTEVTPGESPSEPIGVAPEDITPPYDAAQMEPTGDGPCLDLLMVDQGDDVFIQTTPAEDVTDMTWDEISPPVEIGQAEAKEVKEAAKDDAKVLTKDARAEAKEVKEAAKDDAKVLTKDARAEAKALIEEAEAKAKALIEEAEAKAKALKEAAGTGDKAVKEAAEAQAKELIESAKAQAEELIKAAEAEAKALKEAAEAEAKALKEAAEAEAKAAKEAAEVEAKALKEAAEAEAKAAEAEAKAAKEAAEVEAKAIKEAAEAEARALKEAAEAEAKALIEAAGTGDKAAKEAAEAEAKAIKEAAEAEARALKEAAEAQAKALQEAAMVASENAG